MVLHGHRKYAHHSHMLERMIRHQQNTVKRLLLLDISMYTYMTVLWQLYKSMQLINIPEISDIFANYTDQNS